MDDFVFNCPHCEQSLEASGDMVGCTINCPSCNGTIELTRRQESQDQYASSKSETCSKKKECPYCGEEILAKAKKCKHCGEFLDEALRKQREKELRKSSQLQEADTSATPKQTIATPRGEGCFLQTLNAGCAIIFVVIVVVVMVVIVALNQ